MLSPVSRRIVSSRTAAVFQVPSLLTTLTLAICLFGQHVNATCYWANSTLAPTDQYSIARDDAACFPSQQNSPCCGTGWSCLSDGVCYIRQGNNEFYYRGTCTDKTWNSQQCPGWCFAQDNKTSIPLAKCRKSTGEDWYCCPGDKDCDCSSGKNAVKLGATPATTVTVIGSTSWPGFVASSTSTGSVTSGSILATSISTTGTGTAVGAATSGATSGNSIASNEGGASRPILPIVLGVVLGIIALVVIVVGIYLFRRRSKKRQAARDTGPVAASTPYNTGGNHANPASSYTSSVPAPYPSSGKLPPTHGPRRPGEGYYASDVVAEKDGRRTFGTQELGGDGRRIEMDTSYSARRTPGNRVELP